MTTANHNVKNKNESHDIFCILNPLLKNILDPINENQQQQIKQKTKKDKIHYYKTICENVQLLENELQKTLENIDVDLLIMMEYIMLPLNLVLRIGEEEEHDNNNDNDRLVIISLKWRCIQVSATTITMLANSLLLNVNSHQKWNILVLVRSKKWLISCLISCGIALSYLEEQQKQQQKQSIDTPSAALDNKDNSTESVLKCIQSLMHFVVNNNSTLDNNAKLLTTCTKENSMLNAIIFVGDADGDNDDRVKSVSKLIMDEIIECMNGGLLARIVESCLTILTTVISPQLSTNIHQPSSSSSTKSPSKLHHHSNTVVHQALLTLLTILNCTSSKQEIWKGLFPGCSSALLRFILLKLKRHNRPSTSSKNTALALYILGRFIFITLSFCCNTYSTNNENNDDNDSLPTNTTDVVVSSLFTAVQSYQNKQQSLQKKSPNSTTSKRNKVDNTFSDNVIKHLSFPVYTIFQLLNNSDSNSCIIKLASVALSRVILIETNHIWLLSFTDKQHDDQCSRDICQYVMEYCLILSQSHNNEQIVSSTLQVLSLYSTTYNYTLNTSKPKSSSLQQNYFLSNVVAPRIVELLSQLSNSIKMRSSYYNNSSHHPFILLSGYLQFIMIQLKKQQQQGQKKNINVSNVISASFSSDTACSIIRSSFSALLEIDFQNSNINPTITDFSTTSSLLIEQNESNHDSILKNGSFNILGQSSTFIRFLHLQKTSTSAMDNNMLLQPKLVQTMLRQIGFILGEKRSILFVDRCFSDLLDLLSSCSSPNNHYRLRSSSLGLILVAKEILLGCFVDMKDNNIIIQSKKNKQFLVTFCRTILPVIINSTHLWNAPTTAKAMKQNNSSNCNNNVTSLALHSNIYLQSLLLDFIGTLCYLLQKDSTTTFLPLLLYPIIEKLNPTYNHPFVRNIAFQTLQRIAFVHNPGTTTSSSLVCDLLSSNFDYLVDSITSKLHGCCVNYRGSDETTIESEYLFLPGVVEVALRCTFLDSNNERNKNNDPLSITPTDDNNTIHQSSSYTLHPSLNMKLLSDLIEAVFFTFDRKISTVISIFQNNNNNIQQQQQQRDDYDHNHVISLHFSFLLSMSRLFGVMLQSLYVMFLRTTTLDRSNIDHQRITNNNERSSKNPTTGNNNNKPWLEFLLVNVDLEKTVKHDEECCLSNNATTRDTRNDEHANHDDNSSASITEEADNDDDANSIIDDTTNDEKTPTSIDNNIKSHLMKQMELIKLILTRCTFFLSFEELKIQIAVVDSIKEGYQLLFDISSYVQKSSSPSSWNLPGDPLLMSISDHWSNIHVRLKATSSALVHHGSKNNKVNVSFTLSPSSSVLSSPPSSNNNPYMDADNYGSLAYFYSSLLDVISLLSELANDFMVGRLENDIWPIMANVLGNYIRHQLPTSTKMTNNYIKTKRSTTATAIEIISTLKCLSKIFSIKKCGLKLIGIIPTICTLILPLLSIQSDVGEMAFITIKSLLQVDVSSLYRKIRQVSGQKNIRLNPLLSLKQKKNSNSTTKSLKQIPSINECCYPEDIMKYRSRLLLQFIDTIEEQAFI